MKKKITEQDIQDHLDGLNRTDNGVVVSADTERLTAIAVKNYCEWFSYHKIPIHRDEDTKVWKLGRKEKSGNERKRNRTL